MKRFLFVAGLIALCALPTARAVELNSVAVFNGLNLEADFNLDRNAALLADFGVDGVGAGYKYFLDRNHAGFNVAARGRVGLNTPTVGFAGTLGYRFLIPTANSGIRGIELEVEGGPAITNVGNQALVGGTIFLRAGIRLN